MIYYTESKQVALVQKEIHNFRIKTYFCYSLKGAFLEKNIFLLQTAIFAGVILLEIKELISFLNKLEDGSIFYKLDKVRDEAIMVEIAVPGQRWEVEFLDDGTIVVEKFISDGDIYDVKEIETLFKDFSD